MNNNLMIQHDLAEHLTGFHVLVGCASVFQRERAVHVLPTCQAVEPMTGNLELKSGPGNQACSKISTTQYRGSGVGDGRLLKVR
jgi:hypothetical protein